MMNFGTVLFIAASGFALVACSGEPSPSITDPAAEIDAAEAPTSEATGPNYCHGPDYDPEDPFRFVMFNLKIKPDEMTRLRSAIKAELEAINKLPPEAVTEAVQPYTAKVQILADFATQPREDRILATAAELCNFEIYEETECRGSSKRSIRKVSKVADSLSFVMPHRGQDAQVFFSAPDYSDVTIETDKMTKQWSRSLDGVERYTFVDSIAETTWVENPDCSGRLMKSRLNKSLEVSWTSPKQGALSFSYKRCVNGQCHEGKF